MGNCVIPNGEVIRLVVVDTELWGIRVVGTPGITVAGCTVACCGVANEEACCGWKKNVGTGMFILGATIMT